MSPSLPPPPPSYNHYPHLLLFIQQRLASCERSYHRQAQQPHHTYSPWLSRFLQRRWPLLSNDIASTLFVPEIESDRIQTAHDENLWYFHLVKMYEWRCHWLPFPCVCCHHRQNNASTNITTILFQLFFKLPWTFVVVTMRRAECHPSSKLVQDIPHPNGHKGTAM